MKTIKLTVVVLTAFLSSSTAITYSQDSDSLGVIGDNLDLYAVLDAFKNSESIEAFEKTLNDPESNLNNLDLNEDDEVDYIQVHDEGEDDAHAFVLRIDMGEGKDETQDVAVIELEKSGDNEATVQIIGDEEIYGEDYIIEPKQNEGVTERLMVPNWVVINVWGWPSVRFVFGPRYVRWRSPYRWGVYPNWWKPWRPRRWGVYHGFHAHHRRHFHVVKVRRCNRAHKHFVKHRRTCVRVRNHKHHHVHVHHHHHGHKSNKGGHKNGVQKPDNSGHHKTKNKSNNKGHQTKKTNRNRGNSGGGTNRTNRKR